MKPDPNRTYLNSPFSFPVYSHRGNNDLNKIKLVIKPKQNEEITSYYSEVIKWR